MSPPLNRGDGEVTLVERLRATKPNCNHSANSGLCHEAADTIEALVEALTPSAETKAAYIGEFSFSIELSHPRLWTMSRRVDVPWTTIKEIMAAIRARAKDSSK